MYDAKKNLYLVYCDMLWHVTEALKTELIAINKKRVMCRNVDYRIIKIME